MLIAQPGSTVTIRYIGTLDNGRIFHSTEAEGAQTYTLGADQLFPALEAAIIGMPVGSAKNIYLTAAEAYGPRQPENVIRLSRQSFPAGKELRVGQKISIDFSAGGSRVMQVIAVEADSVTLDGNHPLAGCNLTFALQLEHVE